MIRYIFRKTGYGLSVVAGVAVILSFLFFSFLAADEKAVYEMTGQNTDQETILRIKQEFALDQPAWKQMVYYLNDLSPLSFHQQKDPLHVTYPSEGKYSGFPLLHISQTACWLKLPYLRRSYQSNRPVSDIVFSALPGTIVLAFSAIIFATFTGILLGIISALKANTWIDKSLLFFSTAGVSVPSFFAAVFLAWLLGYAWHHITGLPTWGSLFEIDDYTGKKTLQLQNLVLPALTLGIRPLSVVVQLTRNALLEALEMDYTRTATAKGLSRFTVIFKHALRNSLNPVVTAISGWLGGMLAGAVFVEYIFGWKGLGKEIVDALGKLDYPVVMGAAVCISLMFVFLNILVDISYGILDPKLRK